MWEDVEKRFNPRKHCIFPTGCNELDPYKWFIETQSLRGCACTHIGMGL